MGCIFIIICLFGCVSYRLFSVIEHINLGAEKGPGFIV